MRRSMTGEAATNSLLSISPPRGECPAIRRRLGMPNPG
jgi:hypothetical protein